MNTEDRLQRLEALLDRVRRRATEARLPLSRLLDTARSQPRAQEQLPPPVRQVPPEPVAAAPAPPPAPAAAYVPYTVVPATLELVDTPPPEALGEEDVLDEIPSDMLESVPPSGGVAAREPFDTTREEEEPPASSQRPRAAALLDSASEPLLDEGREVPLKTPPPESGPQEAPIPTGLGSPHIPDVDRLEADLSPGTATGGSGFDSLEPPFGAVSMPAAAAAGPTVEQLGQTIELEEGGSGPSLELDAPATPPPPPPPQPEELEASLPSLEAAGRYDDELMPPPEAREELDAHREKTGESVRPAAEAQFIENAAPTPGAQVVTTLPAIAELPIAEFSPPAEPELVGRPPLESGVVFTVKPNDQPSPRPSTFLELLDSSIALGG
ncbi:MAG TPA: hypothetical protein VG937_12450 [Polyangiaceae bacterium]|nr:hypothetical protein [Polyangiaceae bacterium]